jgi:acyl dehydratase
MVKKIYYEDIEIGYNHRFGSYTVTRDEIVSFAAKWDPQPFHLDEQAGKESVFGGITASGAHIFAIQSLLSHSDPKPHAVLAGLGLEEMRLITPVRPDDVLSIETTVLDKRPSSSKPDRGIITKRYCIVNHRDEIVMEQVVKVLVCRLTSNGSG